MRSRITIGLLVLMLLGLQWRLWVAEGGVTHAHALRTQVAALQSELEQLRQRNGRLAAEVQDLNVGSLAVEARARTSLGMIEQGETFYLVVSTDRP